MSSLREILKPISGAKKHFLLMRIAGLDPTVSRRMIKVTTGTYNAWLYRDEEFKDLYHRIPELEHDHRHEAIQMLRRDNQLEAVLLEGKILSKMKEELDTGEYSLIRTHLAREVYSKLISELDIVPQVRSMTWEQKVGIMLTNIESLPQGEVYDAELEEVSLQPSEYTEGHLITTGEQTIHEAQTGT